MTVRVLVSWIVIVLTVVAVPVPWVYVKSLLETDSLRLSMMLGVVVVTGLAVDAGSCSPFGAFVK